jgi:NADH:ubiquinone oxidoreductase subunit 4 (subunit M)
VGVLLILVGAAIPALILLGLLARLSLDPLSGLWYGFLLITGHHIGLYTTALAAVLGVCFAAAIRIALMREVEQYRPR